MARSSMAYPVKYPIKNLRGLGSQPGQSFLPTPGRAGDMPKFLGRGSTPSAKGSPNKKKSTRLPFQFRKSKKKK